MELKPGYKLTEVGVIPENWEMLALEGITDPKCPICYGIVQVGPFSMNGIPVLAIKNLNTDYSTDVHRASSEIEKPYARSRIDPGDILISVKGTTGRIGIVPQHFYGNISRDLARLRLSNENVPEFWFQMLQSQASQRKLNVATVGTTRMELSIGILKQVRMPRPPKDQQRIIAEALGDVDALIAALDRHIAKKRDLKQAAMQQLLTGQTRLPGFSGEWEVKTLHEVSDCLDNVRVPLNESQRDKMRGDYPYCGANGVLDYVDGYVIDDDIILMAEDGGYFDEYETRPIAYRMVGKCWVNNHAHILKANAGFDQGFLFYSLVHKNILPFLASGTRAKLNKSEMAKIEVKFPTEKAEQTAIAAVLSDMDAEIAALEARRDKTRLLKQGMMQELLTGKTRLV